MAPPRPAAAAPREPAGRRPRAPAGWPPSGRAPWSRPPRRPARRPPPPRAFAHDGESDHLPSSARLPQPAFEDGNVLHELEVAPRGPLHDVDHPRRLEALGDGDGED